MKPTYGMVSRYGLVGLASSLDQIGPITRDVTDCVVMNAICGYDSLDSTSQSRVPNYLDYLQTDIKGMKIGFPGVLSKWGGTIRQGDLTKGVA